ncbi:TraR/DksA family transcriptional regulator [Lelliottia amnigena]|uniref:TraR/DksA family transcriptional regulator n=1 Tax=Lelliottia amnigena TaxID=61646 RepID=UPI001F219F76|nr:TraR/DksA family transcriptional regulator [Lelliottia amnigena]UJD93683.1 TraR/DksA family transcriptional regulator [Lelliottia amnigena]
MTSEIIDQASELEEMLRENAIAAHRLNPNAVSATHCEECDEQLSDERRKAYPGCTMCVACLQIVELRKKQGRS